MHAFIYQELKMHYCHDVACLIVLLFSVCLQCGFMVNFAASTLQSLHKVLPKAAAKAQQQFDANLAQWDAIINNSSNAAAS
jgi:hypothetical protein